MVKWVIPNDEHLAAEQVKDVPIRKEGKDVGRCIDADDRYIYCEVDEYVLPTSADIVRSELKQRTSFVL